MPKQTFFNLPEEKRERILETAVAEFAEKGYKGASITQMVAEAGIAKGSFYQYFEDKDDLYAYIVKEKIASPKLKTFEREKGRLESLTLTGFLRVVFRMQVEDFRQRPHVMRIGLDLVRLTGEPVYQKVMAPYQAMVDSYFIPFIEYEVAQGELDGAVNPRLLNYMLVSLGQYLVYRMESEGLETVTVELIDALVDDLEYILTNGIYGGRQPENGRLPL